MNRRSLARVVSALLSAIDKDRKTSIGICGAPGSGKSTFARTLAHGLQHSGVPCCQLSLDNYYLSQSRRKCLAKDVHPGFRQRGVPGTHDLKWLLADFDRLRSERAEGLRLPVFDKSTDDLVPESQWPSVHTIPQVILLEGWCVGVPPPDTTAWEHPPEGYNAEKDSDEGWLAHVHKAWMDMYTELRKRLHQVWYIRVPHWGCVVDWRWQQELEMPRMRLQSRRDVAVFLSRFHGIFQHMQESYPGWADQIILADQNHNLHLPD